MYMVDMVKIKYVEWTQNWRKSKINRDFKITKVSLVKKFHPNIWNKDRIFGSGLEQKLIYKSDEFRGKCVESFNTPLKKEIKNIGT